MKLTTTVALAGAIALGLAATALGHDPEAEARFLLSQKLDRSWVTQNGFVADFDAALAAAAKTDKPVFAYFTVSYADLPRCESVENGVLSSPEFKEFGKNVVLFTHIDSGLMGPYSDLRREKGGLEVPYFLVLDDQGNVTARVDGAPSVQAFHEAVKAGVEFAALTKKADQTADEQVYVLAHSMDLRGVKLQLAKDRVERLGELTKTQRTLLDAALLRLEVWTSVADVGGSWKRARAAGKLFAEMWAAARVPSTDEHALPFFTLILDHAEDAGDADLFEKALGELDTRLGDKAESKGFIEEQTERLKALREKADEASDSDAE